MYNYFGGKHAASQEGSLEEKVAGIFREYANEAQEEIKRWQEVDDPEKMLDAEKEIHRMAAGLADEITATLLEEKLSDEEFCEQAREESRHRHPERESAGVREVTVKLLGGKDVRVKTSYVVPRPSKKKKRGRRRKVGKRGKAGKGEYPALKKLGFANRVSPALHSTVARTATEVASFEVAREMLQERGIDLSVKQIRRLTLQMGQKMVEKRQERLEVSWRGPTNNNYAGKRIAICVDGGRVRMRQYRKGRRLRNGRHRFDTPWREPKMLVIYEVDEKGRKVKKSEIVYDCTMGNHEKLCELLVMHLRENNAAQATEIMLIADGAPWIWDLKEKLLRYSITVDHEVVDYYHAAAYLYNTIDQALPWSQSQKQQWFRAHRRLLKQGKIDKVIEALQILVCRRGRPVKGRKKILTAIDFFTQHQHRMAYPTFKRLGIPMGSGLVESAIRRVINLRLKSASSFWLEKNVEAMLVLRCALKMGRWQNMVKEFFCEPEFIEHAEAA